MKNVLLFILFVLGFTHLAYAQQKAHFDVNSKVGSKIIVKALSYSNEINKYYFNKQALDKLVVYLKQNETVYIEINCFSDFTDSPLMNLMATKDQAEDIRLYLVSQGIAGSRINTVGNGDMFPVHKEEEVSKMSESMKKEANIANRRIEIVIIKKG